LVLALGIGQSADLREDPREIGRAAGKSDPLAALATVFAGQRVLIEKPVAGAAASGSPASSAMVANSNVELRRVVGRWVGVFMAV
jgi:hypothetical protein